MMIFSGSVVLAGGWLSPVLYLDPGSGSYLIQLLLAAVLGGAFVIKMYWQKIKDFFKNRGAKKPDDPTM